MSRPYPTGADSADRPLTVRQLDVLNFIIACVESRGYPPTVREICAHFGWHGTCAAVAHLRALVRKGRIAIDREMSRGIRVLGVRWRMVSE